jgi:two-component system, NtrC family, sensor histidine kinase HydH
MKILARTYWVPIVVALLLVTAVGFWAWQTMRGFRDIRQEYTRRFASGMFNTLQGTLSALGDHGRFRRDHVERLLKGLIGDSPLRFVVIEQDGQRLVQVGDVPDVLPQPADSGELLRNDVAIFWRKVRLQDGPDGASSTVSAVSDTAFDLRLGKSDQTVILGIAAQPASVGGGRRPLSPLTALLVTFVVVVLFIGASTVAWIMTIRSGLLAEQLEIEQARRNHLEELSLAAAGLAHETKNPLGIILGLAQRIAGNPQVPEESRAMAEHIVDEVDKATARVGSFLTFARQRQAKEECVDVQEVVAKVADVMRTDFNSAGVKLALACASMHILADHEMLSQILVNLLLNSLHASSAGTTVFVQAEAHGTSANLSVEDQGSGIEPKLLPDIFKPYVSGCADGHGLGLAVVKRFVEQHGWTIRADSQVGRGTRITISEIRMAKNGEAEG